VRLPANARTWTETGLVNGQPYAYTLRTLGADGSSAEVAAPTVVPGTAPGRVGVRKVTPGKRKVTVVWRPADGHGRSVTAYRLTAGGRTVRVAGDATRATIRRLPSGKRVRVTIQARNEIGWGPKARTPKVRIH
jgi:hypothetical protein